MERVRRFLRWDQRSELVKTLIMMVIIIGGVFGGYGIFMLAMGTTSPLVVVTSESMVPTLNRGDMLVLQRQSPEEIELGEIIVYTASWYTEAPIVHRVVRIETVNGEYRYYTKGDANAHEDIGYRVYADVVGVVVLQIPAIGHVSLFLQQPEGRVLIVVVFIVILVVPEVACKDEKKDEPGDGSAPSQTDTAPVS
ncbi:MAG: signal peptidase I [Candidatus Thorarchaeota archaeon]|nr:signal peptidase I [Candidatus Thorarchaeota archaeon]